MENEDENKEASASQEKSKDAPTAKEKSKDAPTAKEKSEAASTSQENSKDAPAAKEKSNEKSASQEQSRDEPVALEKSEEAPATQDNSKETKKFSYFEKILGFTFEEMTSWTGILKVLHRPTNPSSLAVARILFGFLMMIDVFEERGFGEVDLRWGEPTDCRFPLLTFLEPLPLHWMCILYMTMWISACGIMLGWNYKLSCITFVLPYWYLFLLDKTSWNNHSYMFGILALLFLGTDSHSLWSVDAWAGKIERNRHVPLWNYGVLRFQVFLLYFYAGLKKTESDWINGYSMNSLSEHWVFYPLKIIFNTEQIDLWVVHIFGFLIDISMGFMIYFDKTRALSFYLLTAFHLMNSQMFHIGMFPFVCLGTMPLFCGFDWPRKFLSCLPVQSERFKCLIEDEPVKNPEQCIYPEDMRNGVFKIKKTHVITAIMLYIHIVIQLFLPYSHFLTQGFNNWTNGLYGYSWDMMVHTWDTSRATIKVVDKDTNETMFIDPEVWVHNNKWQRHADMVRQYSKCVEKNLAEMKNMKNIELYVDIWVSLNKRYHQRMFDPRVDILSADWSPFRRVSWVMPLLANLTPDRDELLKIQKEILTWSNYSDVLFMADFPGFTLENYVHKDLENITLTVFQGQLAVEIGNTTRNVSKGGAIAIPSATFHNLTTVSETPSAFMYTFFNRTKIDTSHNQKGDEHSLYDKMVAKFENFASAVGLMSRAILRVMHSTPMIRRVKVHETDLFYQ